LPVAAAVLFAAVGCSQLLGIHDLPPDSDGGARGSGGRTGIGGAAPTGAGGAIGIGGAATGIGGNSGTGGFTGTGGAVGTGGRAGTGGAPGVGGAVIGTGGLGTGGLGTGGLAGVGGGPQPPGYVTTGAWHGCVFTDVDTIGSTVMPRDFTTGHQPGTPYCVQGAVNAAPFTNAYIAFGFNTSQAAAGGCGAGAFPVARVAPTRSGIAFNFTNNVTSYPVRVQINGLHVWCTIVTATAGPIFIPYSSFTQTCYSAVSPGMPYDKTPISSVYFMIPSVEEAAIPFKLCLGEGGIADAYTVADAPP